jgi:hypothetical protein
MSKIDEIKEEIASLIKSGKVEWKKHALQRIFERSISRYEVKQAILNGLIIERYEDDYPFPSFLIAYINEAKPLHVLLSYDKEAQICYIITTYEPDRRYFQDDLLTRKNDETK